MTSPPRLALVCAVALAAAPPHSARPPQSAGAAGTPFYQAPGTRRMFLRLSEFYRTIDPKDNFLLNARRAEMMRASLANTTEPSRRLDLLERLAVELLQAGRTGESIKAWLEARHLAGRGGVRSSRYVRSFLLRNLAVAYLRQGEQDNCLTHHTTDSCLIPIRAAGVHRNQDGSRAAVKVLTELLNESPDNLEARWLLNIAFMTVGEYPDGVPARWLVPPKVFASEYDIKRFPDRAPALGLDVDDLAGGVVADDFDDDGNLDILASTVAVNGPTRLFHNDADGTFTERTQEAGLVGEVNSLNMVQADYNNDGFLDVLLLRGGWAGKGGALPSSLLRNNGDGTFADVTEEAGLLSFHPTQTATWLDYNNDGWIDLYIGTESEKGNVHPCELYRNNGDGTFTELAERFGVANVGFVKGVASGDYNNDGRPDLYLSRRGQTNVLYRNDGPKDPGGSPKGGWRFTDVSASAGVTEPIMSFPTWFFDYDDDGWLDIFVAGYLLKDAGDLIADGTGQPHTSERARLYHNDHDGTFTDVTRQAGLYRVVHAMGSNYGDLDNDGFLDMYLGTGDPNLGTLIPNRMFRNDGGRRFQDVTTSAGVGHLQKGHAVAFADFDNDGDQDIYEVMGGVYEGDNYRNVLYENPGHDGHFITLTLQGVKTNRAAIGARIKVTVVTAAGERDIYKTVSSGGSFGGNPLRQEIGLGDARSIRSVEIAWPVSRTTQVLRDLAPDRFYRVREGDAQAVPVTPRTWRLPGAPFPRPRVAGGR